MADRILFAGAEPECFILQSGAWEVSTVAARRNPSMSDMTIGLSGLLSADLTSGGVPVTVDAGSTIWIHFTLWLNTVTFTDANCLALVAGGVQRFRINRRNNNGLSVQVNNSPTTVAWTNILDMSYYAGLATYDFSITEVTSGNYSLKMYVGNTLVNSVNFSSPYLSGTVNRINVGGANSSSAGANSGLSEIIITENIPTVNANVRTIKAESSGFADDWTGGYTDVVKTEINDATGISSSTSGQIELFTYRDVLVPVDKEIRDVWLWNRAKSSGSPPTRMKSNVKVGANIYSSPQAMLDVGYAPVPFNWPANPATSAKWTQAIVNAMELGVESAP